MATTIRFEENDATKLAMTDKLKIGGKLFLQGFSAQAADESTAGVALFSGLWNGLKYKGDLKRGIKTGITVELTLCAMNGVKNVIRNYRKVKNEKNYKLIREEENHDNRGDEKKDC